MKVKRNAESVIAAEHLIKHGQEYRVLLPGNIHRGPESYNDKTYFLLECEGGHKNNSSIPAYWIAKNQLIITEIDAYKGIVRLNQRWRYANVILEVVEFKDQQICSCKVVNTASCNFVLGSISLWTVGNCNGWEYLEGQDKPQ